MLGRRPKRAASSFPLGAGGGAYYTNMTLGFQTFPLFVDTGSSLCAVPSMECVACTTNEECVAHKGGACPGQVHYAPFHLVPARFVNWHLMLQHVHVKLRGHYCPIMRLQLCEWRAEGVGSAVLRRRHRMGGPPRRR